MLFQVLDIKTGNPVANVKLVVMDLQTNAILHDAVTLDNNATFDIDQYSSNRYAVIISAPGYVSQSITYTQLMASQDGIIYLKKQFPFLLIGAALAATYAMKRKKSVGSAEDRQNIIFVAGGLAGLWVVVTLIKKLGLGGDPSAGEQTDPGSEWNPNYWKQFNTFTYVINATQAAAYAKAIHDAFTLFQDDYNAIYNVFSSMRTRANVSYLADIFQQKYGENLLSFLGDGGGIFPWDGLSSEHMATILAYVNKLPSN